MCNNYSSVIRCVKIASDFVCSIACAKNYKTDLSDTDLQKKVDSVETISEDDCRWGFFCNTHSAFIY
jgi:hypothetical protein